MRAGVLGASGPIRCLRDGDASSTTSRSSQLYADADWSYFALSDVSQNSLDWSNLVFSPIYSSYGIETRTRVG
jgi:hypothetical protein